MKLSISTDPLRDAVIAVSKVIQAKAIAEIASAVLVKTISGEVFVSGTSAYGDIRINTGQEGPADMAFAVSADRLKQLLERTTADVVKIDLPDFSEASQLTFNGGNVKGKLKMLQPRDFPPFSEPAGKLMFECDIPLKSIVGKVSWAAGVGAHFKPVLQGVNIIASKGGLEAFCAQGVYACSVTVGAEGADITTPGFVSIPVQAARSAAQVFELATIRAFSSRTIFETDSMCMSVPILLSGESFPLKMPVVSGSKISIGKAGLLSAFRSCISVAEAKVPTVKIEGTEDGVNISAAGPTGDIEEKVACEECAAVSAISMNGLQVVSALGSCPGEIVDLVIPTSGPATITSGEWKAFLMPMRN